MAEKTDAPPDYQGGQVVQDTYNRPQARKLHDANVTLEEYMYYAQKTREEEKTLESPQLQWRTLLSGKKKKNNVNTESNGEGEGPKRSADVNLGNPANRLEISDEEWTNASRAFRTASWGAAFYLVRPRAYLARVQDGN